MLSNSRLTEVDVFLDHAKDTLATKLWGFFDALDKKGFSKAESLTLTVELLKAVIAVPSPAEQGVAR